MPTPPIAISEPGTPQVRRGRTRDALRLAALLGLGLVLRTQAGPYPPAAGQPGSTAVALNDSNIVGWAAGWTHYSVGPNCDLTWQTPELALGPAAGDAFDIVCLGEGGQITLVFDPPITDGPGPDFAVFENAIQDTFLELAYVEASTDGTNFLRFPSHSLTPEPVGAFGSLDPTDISGLAGKYRQGFGTPFDLADLPATPGAFDPTSVAFIRLIDVSGDGSCQDSLGQPIYDPYPAAGSAGFDLDAIATLHHRGAATPLEVWRNTYFGDHPGSPDAADAADPDQDGRANLLEYCLGSHPLNADPTAPLRAVRPPGDPSATFGVEFPRRTLLPDARLLLEFTAKLDPPLWEAASPPLQETVVGTDGDVTILRAWWSPSTPARPSGFVRLAAQILTSPR